MRDERSRKRTDAVARWGAFLPAIARPAEPGAARRAREAPAAHRVESNATGLHEVLAVWALLGAVALAILVTYARFPAADFYHVSGSGLSGGAGRALVFLNFPVAFIAIGLTGVAVARLLAMPGAMSTAGRRLVGRVAALSAALCLVAAWPGVVDQGDLDARLINVVPALGVLLSAGLTITVLRATGVGTARARGRGDLLRIGVAAALIVLALPWILADLGVYVGDVPLIGSLFMSKEIKTGSTLPVVHIGHHHGLDGVLFALSALALSRVLGVVRRVGLGAAIAGYVALMLVYGLTNSAQDFWGEQIVKRGWTGTEIPSVLRPAVTPAWGLMLIGTVIVWLAFLLAGGSRRPGPEGRHPA